MTERKKLSVMHWAAVVLVVLNLMVILHKPLTVILYKPLGLIWLFAHYGLLLRPVEFAVGVVLAWTIILVVVRLIKKKSPLASPIQTDCRDHTIPRPDGRSLS